MQNINPNVTANLPAHAVVHNNVDMSANGLSGHVGATNVYVDVNVRVDE